MYEAEGIIKLINDTQTFGSGFSKREFVITTEAKYPQDIKFELVKDKCAVLDKFKPGQNVTVSFDVRGNEYQGKYYVNLQCWKLIAKDQSSVPNNDIPNFDNIPEDEPSAQELSGDDIPF